MKKTVAVYDRRYSKASQAAKSVDASGQLLLSFGAVERVASTCFSQNRPRGGERDALCLIRRPSGKCRKILATSQIFFLSGVPATSLL